MIDCRFIKKFIWRNGNAFILTHKIDLLLLRWAILSFYGFYRKIKKVKKSEKRKKVNKIIKKYNIYIYLYGVDIFLSNYKKVPCFCGFIWSGCLIKKSNGRDFNEKTRLYGEKN